MHPISNVEMQVDHYSGLVNGTTPTDHHLLPLQTEQPSQKDWHQDLSSMPLWRSGPNTGHAILLTMPLSKAADMAHLCVPQKQALGVCRFVSDIQVRGTHGREDLVKATTAWNAEEVNRMFERPSLLPIAKIYRIIKAVNLLFVAIVVVVFLTAGKNSR